MPARKTRRPMRPKPLMPTLMLIMNRSFVLNRFLDALIQRAYIINETAPVEKGEMRNLTGETI